MPDARLERDSKSISAELQQIERIQAVLRGRVERATAAVRRVAVERDRLFAIAANGAGTASNALSESNAMRLQREAVRRLAGALRDFENFEAAFNNSVQHLGASIAAGPPLGWHS